MDCSQIAKELIDKMNQYMEESMKTSYKISLDEQINLQNMMRILDKHIEFLIDYELKRQKAQNDEAGK